MRATITYHPPSLYEAALLARWQTWPVKRAMQTPEGDHLVLSLCYPDPTWLQLVGG